MRVSARVVPALTAGLLAAGGLTACAGGDGLPTVKGKYGQKPVVQIEKGSEPSGELESTVLSEGDGPAVQRGDLLVADYLGKNYRSGKVFDNSYDRGVPAAFTLKSGRGGVISGWVKSLAGVPVGSRVLLVAPPRDGYGKAGNPQAGIKGGDSLVFVVDLVGAFNSKQKRPKSTPVADLPAGLPTVEGTTDPSITVPDGTEPPTEPKATVIATGTGEEVQRGRLVIVQFTAVGWNNTELGSTWEDGPRGVPVGGPQPTPFDLLEGVPVGSRVILEIPPPTGADAKTDSAAVVIDVLAQFGPAEEKSK